MANYSIALGVQPPQIDISGALQLSNQMQRQKLADQQAQQAMELERERFGLQKQQFQSTIAAQQAAQRERQAQKNALAEYVRAQGAGDENALNKLAAYPDIQSKVLGVRNQMDESSRARFDQSMIRNARRAQFVAGLEGEQKNQAWQSVLKEAVDSGDITPEMYQQYASTPPNDLLLNNVIQQAVPIQQLYQQPTAKMQELEAAGIKQGTPEFRAQVAPAPLPKFEKVNNRLIRINPDGSTADLTPPSAVAPAEKPPSGYRYAEDGNLEFIPGGPADPALKVKDAKFSEGASKAANFANMMTGAEQALGPVTENPIGFFEAITESLPEGAANLARSDEYRAYRQAAMQWVRAKLRRESGAAISAPEFEGEFQTYFPQYGDDAETIKQKNAAREQATRGMIAESRGAYEQLFSEPAQAAPQQAEAQPEQTVQNIDPRAIEMLKSDPSPEAMQEFDAVFGDGAAQRALGR